MICNKCGHEVPEGSKFCNRCGAPIDTRIECPHCHQLAPAGSVFCPNCGKQILASITIDEPEPEPEAVPKTRTRPEQTQTTANAWEQPATPARQQPMPTDDDENESSEPAHYNRNLIIGAIVVAAIIGLLLMVRACGNSDYDNAGEKSDSTTLVDDTADQDPVALLNAELNRANFTADEATTASAVRIPAQGDQPARILGITYKNDPQNRSFYKLYKLTQSGTSWTPELLHTQYLNGRSISMTASELMAEQGQLPRAVKIEDNEYLFFGYQNMPSGSASNGRVSLCLYDINNKKLTTLDYDGPVKTRDDGRPYIYGRPLQAINSPQTRFLQAEAQRVKLLYFPTEEELEAEREAKEKEEEEARMKNPDNADETWNEANQDNVESLKKGEEVTMSSTQYDKPIFNLRDMHRKIESADYIVFSDNKGAVYGFDKKSRKYFTIYAPTSPAEPADIGFANSEKGLMRYKTADGRFQYDLKTRKTRRINEE